MTEKSAELVTIFTGDFSAVLAMEALLRGEGFHPFIPDRNIKTIDPFITGGGVFQVTLAVPESEAQKALACLEESRANAPVAGGGESAPEIDRAAVEALGRRLRWGFVLISLIWWIPLVWWRPSLLVSAVALGFLVIYVACHINYLLQVKKSEASPEGHGITVTCLVLTILIQCSYQYLYQFISSIVR